jgi:hypothetical protein
MTHILLIVFLRLAVPVSAEEFTDSSAALAADFPSGWKPGKSDDPAVVFKLEKGRSSFECVKLDAELSDYYLKARVNELVDSLRGKGNTLSGDIRQAGIHGVATAYYTGYESMGDQIYVAFFTYSGVSYSVLARGFEEGNFRGIVSTIRKPGEKIEAPKKIKIRKEPVPETIGSENAVRGFNEAVPVISTPAQVPPLKREFIPAGEIAGIEEQTPYIPRKPMDLRVWLTLALLWAIGASWAKKQAAQFQNPKLSPPPKDVPPDFFFPFVVSRESTLGGCTYNITTRQKQRLLASFNFPHKIYLVLPVCAVILFHVFWSLLAFFGKGGLVTGAMLVLPGGRFWASAPELLFAAPLFAGVFAYFDGKQALRLFDSQSNLIMEAKKEGFYCLIRDGKGKEIARLTKRSGLSGRLWDFIDTDDQLVFTVKDEYPRGHILRKLFGNLNGALRSRYGIFAGNRRAGFVFLDPASADRFQIHLDFDFARLAHPAQILSCILYIVSKEYDPVYPSAF